MSQTTAPVTRPQAGFKLIAFLIASVILGIGGIVAWKVFTSAPQTQPRPLQNMATLVEVLPVTSGPQIIKIEGLGVVEPARQIELRPRVSGEVERVAANFAPGGVFAVGEELLGIEQIDYELALRRVERSVAEAVATLRLEEGNQNVAQADYELLGDLVTKEDLPLVLREPQLASAQASYAAAKAELQQAKLNLERTSVRAPFNAIIRTRGANLGARVSETTSLATLAGTDRFWIEVTVPVNQLRWLEIPDQPGDPASMATIVDVNAWGPGRTRTGKVVRLAADLEPQGRLARLTVEVEDPLGLQPGAGEVPRLLIGSYVRVVLKGRELPRAVTVPRKFLSDGRFIHVMSADGKLEIREPKIAYSGLEAVLVTEGLADGEKLIVSDMPVAVEGMPLRTSGDAGKGKGSGGDA